MHTLTRTVVPRIKINGSAWKPDTLIECRAVRAVGLTSSAHLRIDLSIVETSPFKLGDALEVAIEVNQSPVTVFSGEVTAVGIDYELRGTVGVIDAYDRSYLLGRKTSIETHVNKTFGDILGKIADAAGLRLQLQTVDTVKYESIQQRGTLLWFLTSICHSAGWEWYVEGSDLIVKKRTTDSPAVAISGDESLYRFSARYAASEEVREVTTRGWDVKEKKEIVGTGKWADAPASSTAAIASNREPTAAGTSWPHNLVADVDAADAAAKTIASRLRSAVVSARGECAPVPEMLPGQFISIENVRPEWNGNYYVTEVEHVFGERQPMVTRFTVGPVEPDSLVDLLGGDDPASVKRITGGVTVGIVTNNNDDKEKLNRVKLKLPYLSNSDETDWARVVQLGAGDARGWLTVPEVGDEVLVAFEHGDIRRPYVIGGLWNGKDRPPVDITQLRAGDGKIMERTFKSRAGHQLTFVDSGDKGARISITHGTKQVELQLAENEIKLSHRSDGEITIENNKASIVLAKDGTVTIKGTAIKLQTTQNDVVVSSQKNLELTASASAKLNANASLELKAGASAKLEASGPTEVKGAIVKLN